MDAAPAALRGLSNAKVLALEHYGSEAVDDNESDGEFSEYVASLADVTVVPAGIEDPNSAPAAQGDGGFLCLTDPGTGASCRCVRRVWWTCHHAT